MLMQMKNRANGHLDGFTFKAESSTDYKAIAEHVVNHECLFLTADTICQADDAMELGKWEDVYDLAEEWIAVEAE